MVLKMPGPELRELGFGEVRSKMREDPAIIQSMEPLCGLCRRPPPMCQFFANGNLRINQKTLKGCLMKTNYSYGIAAESTASSPCSNVPIHWVPSAQRLTLPSGNIS